MVPRVPDTLYTQAEPPRKARFGITAFSGPQASSMGATKTQGLTLTLILEFIPKDDCGIQ